MASYSKNKITLWKAVVFSVLPLLILVIFIELILEIAYFHRRADYPLAIVHEFQGLVKTVQRAKIRSAQERAVESVEAKYRELASIVGLPEDADHGKVREMLVQLLYQEPGEALLKEFQAIYAQHFGELAAAVEASGARLLVLYIPSTRPEYERESCRKFYSALTTRYNLEFLDTTAALEVEPMNRWTLLPLNAHLSRFGCEVVAQALVPWIEENRDYRSGKTPYQGSRIWGDLEPGDRTLWLDDPLVYFEQVDQHGMRNLPDSTGKAKEQRMLLLGDSFMYGPYLSNSDTIPGFLERMCPWVETLNGAIAGYTIQDQKLLFQERARFSQPDLVVLQVLDNDISGQFYFYLEQFARDRKSKNYQATPGEEKYFKRVKEHLSASK